MNILASNGVETPPTGVIGTIHRLLIFSSKPLRMLLMTGFAWYNLRPYHTIAISVNLISNAFVQAFSGHSDAYEYCQQFQIAQFVIDFFISQTNLHIQLSVAQISQNASEKPTNRTYCVEPCAVDDIRSGIDASKLCSACGISL